MPVFLRALSLFYFVAPVYIDYKDDEVMARRTDNFLKLTNRDGLLFMRERGYEHVQSLLAGGELDCLEGAALPKFVSRRRVLMDAE